MWSATAGRGTRWRPNTRDRARTGRRPSPWGIWHSPSRGRGATRSWRASTPSSWAAAPATSRPGWRGAGPDRWASTTRPSSWPPPAASRGSSGCPFPLIHGDAEQVPLPDESFDLAISEYGASIWCDPYRWIPEAARLLRPGRQARLPGERRPAHALPPRHPDEPDAPAGDRLLRPYLGMHRFEWSEDESVEFHLPHGAMIGLLRRSGLAVEELIEVEAPAGSTTRYPWVPLDWARQWPCEEVWKARKFS